ncbi:hypothetical protein [Sphingomonas suaedae]|nr:hypothetical protein [Sphingomonas suaedae]
MIRSRAMDKPSSGLAAARARRKRIVWTVAALAASGAVVGFFSALFEAEDGAFLEGIPAAWAVAASIVTVLAVLGGGYYYNRVIDELDRRDNQWASALALNLLFVGYACWYLNWKGGLVPEPQHEALILAAFIVAMLAYAWKKFRP